MGALWTMKPVSSAEAPVLDRVDVAAGARVLLEQLDVVRARQQVRRAQARPLPIRPRRSSSPNRYSIRVEDRLSRADDHAEHFPTLVRPMEIAEQPPRHASAPSAPATSRISQVVTLVAVVLRRSGSSSAMGLLWGVAFHWVDVVVLVVDVHGLRVRDDDRLPPLLLAPELPGPRAGVKAGLAILGCMTVQGPLTQWVTDHRKHHAFSDKEGDPHSPHAGHPETPWGAFTGFVHAHVGWMFSNLGMEQGREYGKDLYEDRLIRTIDRLYLLWVVLTLGIPFAIGYCVSAGPRSAIEALVWGGLIRIFLYQHATFAVNSICHMFGQHATTARATSRGTTGSSPSSSSARAGTTTTTRSRPRHGTASPGGSTTSPGGSSAASRRLGLAWDVKLPTADQMRRRAA